MLFKAKDATVNITINDTRYLQNTYSFCVKYDENHFPPNDTNNVITHILAHPKNFNFGIKKQLMVVNQFGDFDEGPELLDLYFGGNRPPLLVNALYVGIFYAASLLLALYFLQPRGSRLQVLKENPTLLSRERLSVAALGGREDPGASAPPPSSSEQQQQQQQERQREEMQQRMQRMQELTTAALQPEALNRSTNYSAFETASAGVGAVVTGGGGGVFKRGGWPGGWGAGGTGLGGGNRGEEAKEAGRGGGLTLTGRLRKSSRASVSSGFDSSFGRGKAYIGLEQHETIYASRLFFFATKSPELL